MRISLLLAIALGCHAQQQEFEVASIKPNTTMGSNISINRGPGNGLIATNVTLRSLITFAYDIRDHQLAGGPAWLDKDRYDIVAKPPSPVAGAPEPTAFPEVFRLMRMRVQALLADRFKLVVHTETREMPVYALVVGKNGPHLAASKSENMGIHGSTGLLQCQRLTMKEFAERALGNRMGRTVLDKTGLTGEYDFEIKYAEDRGAAAASDVSGPDFLTAMQEQLGLKLEQQKGPVPVIVIDRAEKAEAN
jgi:uncharacterized protein (TIGR03435 family)